MNTRMTENAVAAECRVDGSHLSLQAAAEINNLEIQIIALREQVARLTAPPEESDLKIAQEIVRNVLFSYANYSIKEPQRLYEEIFRSLAQVRRQGREQMREEFVAAFIKASEADLGQEIVDLIEKAGPPGTVSVHDTLQIGWSRAFMDLRGALPLDPPCHHTRLTLRGPCPRCGATFDKDGKQK